MPRKYKNYTDQDIVEKSQQVKSMAALLKELGLREAGGNYSSMRKSLQRLNLDCSHWTGEGWSAGKQLKDWSEYTRVVSLKPHLITKRGHKCERCNLANWEGEKIPLEIEHINGDSTDHREENLKLLCCNCHALTPTWRGRNARKISS